jgi:predicted nucleic acid-binding protein
VRFLLDSSAIIAMARAGKLDLLRRVIKKGWITAAVRGEILAHDDETTAAIRPALSSWIATLRGGSTPAEYLRLGLHEGEASLLAIASKADVLVVDEKQGRALAHTMGLTYVGLLGLLLAAAREGVVSRREARDALEALERVGFWISPHLRSQFVAGIGSEEE